MAAAQAVSRTRRGRQAVGGGAAALALTGLVVLGTGAAAPAGRLLNPLELIQVLDVTPVLPDAIEVPLQLPVSRRSVPCQVASLVGASPRRATRAFGGGVVAAGPGVAVRRLVSVGARSYHSRGDAVRALRRLQHGLRHCAGYDEPARGAAEPAGHFRYLATAPARLGDSALRIRASGTVGSVQEQLEVVAVVVDRELFVVDSAGLATRLRGRGSISPAAFAPGPPDPLVPQLVLRTQRLLHGQPASSVGAGPLGVADRAARQSPPVF